MKCQHCGSTEIVPVQDQNYCLNCGYAVNATASKRSAAKAAVAGSPGIPAGQSPDGLVPTQSTRAAGGSWRAARAVHPLRFSVWFAAGMGLVAAIAIAAVLVLQAESDIAVCVVAAAAACWLVGSVLAQGALLYGISRSQDGRPAAHSAWWAAARNSFMETINVNMAALIGLTALAAVGAVVWHLARHDFHAAVPIRIIILTLINVVLVWAALGVYVVRRLSVAAVVVGRVTAADGLRVGWQLYRRGGGHLVAAGLEAVLGRIIAVAGLGVAGYALAATAGNSTPNQTELVIGGVAAVALGVFALAFVMLEWESRVWLRQYRHWVTTFGPAERLRLLTGRVHHRP